MLLKLDVESYEYKLLPWLLAQGALCGVTHLLLEWHLNQLPLPRRLPALGLRLAFHSLLEEGCSSPPRAVFHDDYLGNNLAVPVPFLDDVTTEHSLWALRNESGVRPTAPTVHTLRADKAYLNALRLQQQQEEQPSGVVVVPPKDGVSGDRRSHGHAAHHISSRATGAAMQCLGSCRYEQLACDEHAAAKSYENQLRKRVLPRYSDQTRIA